MKIRNTRVLQQISINYSANIDYKDFIKTYKKCTKSAYFF